MAANKIAIHSTNLTRAKALFAQRFPDEAEHVMEFLRLLGLGGINKGVAVGAKRRQKYLSTLTIFMRHCRKPVTEMNKSDMEDFIQRLTSDDIKRHDGTPYSDNTKRDVKIAVRAYLKWRLPERHVELTGWVDYRKTRKTPEFLTEEEVDALFTACKTNAERFLIAVLFDSGARAEEFMNIRFEDVTAPTDGCPYYVIELKEEYSKTVGRRIGLYWIRSREAIAKYLAECDQSDPQAPVYPRAYNATRIWLSRLGRRVLKRRIHFHLFRKSSATFYAPKLNRQQLCMRYGWRFSSSVPDIYIARAGVDESEVKKAMINRDLGVLEKANQELTTKLGLVRQRQEEQEEERVALLDRIKTLEGQLVRTKSSEVVLDTLTKDANLLRLIATALKDSGIADEVFGLRRGDGHHKA